MHKKNMNNRVHSLTHILETNTKLIEEIYIYWKLRDWHWRITKKIFFFFNFKIITYAVKFISSRIDNLTLNFTMQDSMFLMSSGRCRFFHFFIFLTILLFQLKISHVTPFCLFSLPLFLFQFLHHRWHSLRQRCQLLRFLRGHHVAFHFYYYNALLDERSNVRCNVLYWE